MSKPIGMHTLYLKNAREISAANRACKELGYPTTIADIKAHDRYLINIVARLTSDDAAERLTLSQTIYDEVMAVRNA